MKSLLAVGAVGAVGSVTAVVFAVGGCAGRPSAGAPDGTASPTASSPTAACLAIATVGNARLERDFDRFNGPDRDRLAAGAADLRDIAATESTFDQQLARLALPSDAAVGAHSLIHANEARAALTLRAAQSTSLRQLDSLRTALSVADVPVERAVSAIRAALGLPPPDTS